MIEGGWDYVTPAYAIALLALAGVTIGVAFNAMHWAKRAKSLEKDKAK